MVVRKDLGGYKITSSMHITVHKVLSSASFLFEVKLIKLLESDSVIDIAETFVVRFDKNCDCMEYFT